MTIKTTVVGWLLIALAVEAPLVMNILMSVTLTTTPLTVVFTI